MRAIKHERHGVKLKKYTLQEIRTTLFYSLRVGHIPYVAIRVFCRQNRKELALRVLEELDPGDAEKMQAISDALKHELPSSWQNKFIRMLSQGDPKLTCISAKLAGYQRLPAGKELLQALQRNKVIAQGQVYTFDK
jgi:hypothetical protein